MAATQTVQGTKLPSLGWTTSCLDSYATINDFANSFHACSNSCSLGATALPQVVPLHQPVLEAQLSSYSELSANLDFLTPAFQNHDATQPDEPLNSHIDYNSLPSSHSLDYQPSSVRASDPSDLAWIDVWPSDASAAPFLWPAAAMSYAMMAAQGYDILQAEALEAVRASPPPPFDRIELCSSESVQSSPPVTNNAQAKPVRSPVASPKPRGRKPKVRTPPRDSTTPRPASEELKRLSEPKTACLFCRERKIACGAMKRGNEGKSCECVVSFSPFRFLVTHLSACAIYLLVNVPKEGCNAFTRSPGRGSNRTVPIHIRDRSRFTLPEVKV